MAGTGATVVVSTRDFTKFAKALRKADASLYKQLRIRMTAAGEIVASAARTKVAPFSSQAEASIKTKVTSASVHIKAGGPPIAALLELGNKARAANASVGGQFQHPIFGNWVTGKGFQDMHPYLLPAFVENVREAGDALEDALAWAIDIAATDDLE